MKILMVCLGNICRSPIAEGVLRHKLSEKKIKASVDSAGTGNWHAGEQPDLRACEVAKKKGIDISAQRARQITLSDLEEFDKIFVADREVYDSVIQLAKKNGIPAKKIDFLLNVLEKNSDRPVPDPYFGGAEGFEHVFSLIDEACDKIVEKIAEGNTL